MGKQASPVLRSHTTTGPDPKLTDWRRRRAQIVLRAKSFGSNGALSKSALSSHSGWSVVVCRRWMKRQKVDLNFEQIKPGRKLVVCVLDTFTSQAVQWSSFGRYVSFVTRCKTFPISFFSVGVCYHHHLPKVHQAGGTDVLLGMWVLSGRRQWIQFKVGSNSVGSEWHTFGLVCFCHSCWTGWHLSESSVLF